jgi:hypothetical protein
VNETPGQYTGADEETKYPKSRLPGYPPRTARVATCSRMPWISPAKIRRRLKVEEERETLAVERIQASDQPIGACERAVERDKGHEDPRGNQREWWVERGVRDQNRSESSQEK